MAVMKIFIVHMLREKRMSDFNVDSIYPAEEILKTCVDLSWSDERLAHLVPEAQPEIIRCKDCLHWKHSKIRPNYCEVWDWLNTENDFCSFAERRSDESD